MATIASQIQRIADSRTALREKGLELGLMVPKGTYWDDATDTYKAYNDAALTKDDQIDKIAAAFGEIKLYRDQSGKNEIRVPISVRTDGENTVVETTTLKAGYYDNTLVVPYVKVEQVEDIVINVEMVTNRELTQQSAVINPSNGFNYMGQFGYTIVDGAISENNVSFDNAGVIAQVATSGWVDAGDQKKVKVTTSELSKKVGKGTASAIASGAEIVPDPQSDITIGISKGIYGSDRSLVVKSVASQTQGNAVATDILAGKEAWVNGSKVTGTMTNFSGESSAVSALVNKGGLLAVKPSETGYYDNTSVLTTNIVYNPTRVFDTNNNGATDNETMTAKVYYETIPAGYYAEEIKRKISVQQAQGVVEVDYTNHTATFKVGQAGWIDQNVSVDINVGKAVYAQSDADLALTSHKFKVTPAMDQDGDTHAYLTEVTIDNTIIFNALAAI